VIIILMLKFLKGYIFASKNMIGLTIEVFHCYTEQNHLRVF